MMKQQIIYSHLEDLDKITHKLRCDSQIKIRYIF